MGQIVYVAKNCTFVLCITDINELNNNQAVQRVKTGYPPTLCFSLNMLYKTKYLFVLLFVSTVFVLSSQGQYSQGEPLPPVPVMSDSLAIDSIVNDSLSLVQADSLAAIAKEPKPSAITDVVNYTAKDSLIFFGGNIAAMYGSSKINYTDIQMTADYLNMNMDSSIVYAQGGVPDSLGQIPGKPVFKDKGGEYNSETMKYNFKTKKGFITNVITQQGEGFVTGGQSKKMENDDLYLQNGRYTTCDIHDHPHFYFALTKAKVTPGSNAVTGPAYLVLEDVALPVAIPFGFFPFTSSYSSGIIFPQFGQELNRGFFLRNGGYYFAINDYVDLALTGEIYTKGSWGLNARSAYNKRYRYTGNINIGYLTTVTGDKGASDYSKSTDFKLTWSHAQDSKASLNSSFSASVNLSTSTYDRKQMDSYYNPQNFTNNTKSSSVNYTYRFPTIPLSIATNINVNQRTKDSTITATLPDMTITLSRIYPFKRRVAVGAERWYEKIAMNYTGQIRNSIETKEDKFFKSSLLKDWKNGMYHNIPVSATFTLFKNISVTPSFNYTERWYKEKIMQSWDPMASSKVHYDTISGFNRVYNYSGTIGLTTKLYGFFKPWKIFGNKVEMIRHVFTPSLSASAAPDFGDPSYGFWQSYTYIDDQGKEQVREYSPYQNGLFGTAPKGKQGMISLSLQNNLEMKLRSNDPDEEPRKISLIDNFTANISYNAVADSMRWSNITTSMRLKLSRDFMFNLNATFDTYTYQLSEGGTPIRVNIPRWEAGKGLGRLSSANTSFSYNITPQTFKKRTAEERERERKTGRYNDDELEYDYENELDSAYIDPSKELIDPKKKPKEQVGDYDDDGYRRLNIDWSFQFNYSMSYAYSDFNKTEMEYNRRLSHNLSFSANVNITKNWRFSLSSGYDFDQNRLSMMTCNITRNLHCWTFTGSFIPIGPYQSYFFTIGVNSSLLKDLKWDKRSSPYDAQSWN